MKSEKGVTLTSLIIYVMVATIFIGSIALFTSYFFSNMNEIKNYGQSAQEFNKFSMFFLEDVKTNDSIKECTTNKVTFADDTVYEIKNNGVYRNNTLIAQRVDSGSFSYIEEKTLNTNTTKKMINVKMTVEGKNIDGKQDNSNGISFVLKYW